MLRCSKVVVAMSGGVDSSAAVFLLQKQGYDVIGMFMRLINNGDDEHAARRVCAKLGVKFYPVNYSRQFEKEVIDYFIESYKQGLTPNPCVRCNRLIKFGALLKSAREVGADFLATGHYARLRREIQNFKSQITNKYQISNIKSQITEMQINKLSIKYKLLRGKDESKDQSYFLYNLGQKQLTKILFPLGEYTKEEVKKIVDKAKLPYIKKESQDVCFLSGDHNDFLREKLILKKGDIKTLDGKKIGEHQGLPLYTIGQRRGVEIGGVGPFYAAKRDYKTNTLYVVSDRDDPALYSGKLIAGGVNWISGQEPKLPLSCQAVIRYRHQPVKCKVAKPPSGFKSHSVAVVFSQPQRAVTPGQSVVLYNGDEVLGGGIIVA